MTSSLWGTTDDGAWVHAAPQRRRRRKWVATPYALVLPAVLIVAVVMLYPVGHGIWLSTRQTDVWSGTSEFVGFDQYRQLFANPNFTGALRQSLILVFGTVVLGIFVAIAFAAILDQAPRWGRFFRTVVLVPWLLSAVAVGTIWRSLLTSTGGLSHALFERLGVDPIPWLTNPRWAMFALILINVWSISPFPVLIIYAGLKTVDRSLYEAAAIDGAGPLRQFFRVSIPSVSQQIALALIFLSFAAFNSFDTVLLATGGGPGRSTEVLALVLYRLGFERLEFEAAAACMVVLLVINLALSVFYLVLFPNRTGEEARK